MKFRLSRIGEIFFWAALSLATAGVARGANAAEARSTPPDVVQFAIVPAQPGSLRLQGFLRRPQGDGPFAAVILMHGCEGGARELDREWGKRLQAWGYVSLSVDSFGPRGISSSCISGAPPGRPLDAYGALRYLAAQDFVDASRIALMGFSEGGRVTLMDVELHHIDQPAGETFRAAIAFYPVCSGSGIVTVPTLIVNGELDDWSSAEACRRMVAQESDIGVTRHSAPTAPIDLLILPGAYHKFDDPRFAPGHRYMGHLLRYDASALAQAVGAVRDFLRARLDTR